METPGRFIFDTRPSKEAELQRLLRLSEYYAPIMEKLFTRYKEKDTENGRNHRRIIDIGAGTGHTPVQLKEIYPEAEVAYFDSSQELTASARDYAAACNREIVFLTGDIHTYSFETTYDLVVCRFALKHFYDPVRAVHRMVEILETGGRILLMDKDVTANIWYPVFPLYRSRLMAALNKYNKQSHRGGDSAVGRKIKSLLVQNRITQIDSRIIPTFLTGPENAEIRDLQVGVYANLLPELVEAGLITREEGRKDIGRLRRYLEKPEHYAVTLDFIGTGIKDG